jgi:hypothetical protein
MMSGDAEMRLWRSGASGVWMMVAFGSAGTGSEKPRCGSERGHMTHAKLRSGRKPWCLILSKGVLLVFFTSQRSTRIEIQLLIVMVMRGPIMRYASSDERHVTDIIPAIGSE